MVQRLKTCCCCGDLRTGTIIIGGLSILGGVLMIIGILLDNDAYNSRINSTSVQITTAIIYLILITTSIIMIVGGVQRNWKLIVPWLVIDGLLIGLQFIAIIIIFIMFLYVGFIAAAVLYMFLGSLVTALALYLWYVPFSYHLNLRDEAQTPVYNQSPVYIEAPPVPPKYYP